jgi:hypothetical protein
LAWELDWAIRGVKHYQVWLALVTFFLDASLLSGIVQGKQNLSIFEPALP